MIELRLDPPPSGPICDFCAYPQQWAVFACQPFDFVRFEVVHRSDHGWAACRECTRLVQKEDWRGLLDRGVKRFVRAHRVPAEDVPWVRSELATIHGLFREHRIREV